MQKSLLLLSLLLLPLLLLKSHFLFLIYFLNNISSKQKKQSREQNVHWKVKWRVNLACKMHMHTAQSMEQTNIIHIHTSNLHLWMWFSKAHNSTSIYIEISFAFASCVPKTCVILLSAFLFTFCDYRINDSRQKDSSKHTHTHCLLWNENFTHDLHKTIKCVPFAEIRNCARAKFDLLENQIVKVNYAVYGVCINSLPMTWRAQ